jgi:hypothetical protein
MFFEFGCNYKNEFKAFEIYSSSNNAYVIDSSELDTRINDANKNPFDVDKLCQRLYYNGNSYFEMLKIWMQERNDCTSMGTGRAIEAWNVINGGLGRKELKVFTIDRPWLYGALSSRYGDYGDNGRTMSVMLQGISEYGVLPGETQGLENYSASRVLDWVRRFAKDSAPYDQYWDAAKQYKVTVSRLDDTARKNEERIYAALEAGFTCSFGTNVKVALSPVTHHYNAGGSWAHCMCLYGYNHETGEVGLDNSHGDGFGWLTKSALTRIVNSNYFDAFIIADITAMEPEKENWEMIGG